VIDSATPKKMFGVIGRDRAESGGIDWRYQKLDPARSRPIAPDYATPAAGGVA